PGPSVPDATGAPVPGPSACGAITRGAPRPPTGVPASSRTVRVPSAWRTSDPPSTEIRAGPSARASVTSDAPSSPAVTAAAGPDPLGAPGGSGGTATSTVAGPTGTRATTVSAAPSDPSAGSCASPAPDGSPAPEVRPASHASPDRGVPGAAGVAGEAA